MSETKRIGGIHVITDTENGYDRVGEVYGGFESEDLMRHVRNYGHEELLTTLALMTAQVIEVYKTIQLEKRLAEPPDQLNVCCCTG